MATIAKRPHKFTLSLLSTKALLLKAAINFSEDSVPRLAAAFSFYAILSVAPLLVLAIVAAGFFFGEADARTSLLSQVQSAMGKEGRELIETLIQNTYKPGASTIATILSLAVTFFSASGLFIQLSDALNSMWGVPEKQREEPFYKSLIVTRVLSFVMVMIFGVIVLGWLVIDSWLVWLQGKADRFLGWPYVSIVISVIFLTLVFAVSYRAIPKVRVDWGDVWLGSFVAALGIAVAKYLLGMYFSYAHVAGAFGPAGALVLVLLWIYYTSQIYFFGAELVYAYAQLYGSRAKKEDNKALSYS